MKLLKDEVIEKSKGSVKITLNPITTSMQSALIDYAITPTFESKIGFSLYGLRNIIKSVEVSGVPYLPIDLAARADIDDDETRKALLTIGELLDEACFVSATEKKRLDSSDQQSEVENTAQPAQDH